MHDQPGPPEENEPAEPQEQHAQAQEPQNTAVPFSEARQETQGGETPPDSTPPPRGGRWQAMRRNPRSAIATGIAVSNVIALLVMLATYWFAPLENGSSKNIVFIASDFVLLPLIMGIVSAYFWQEAGLSTILYVEFSMLNAAVALLLSYCFLHEGVICLLMASPLLILFILLGSFIGRVIFTPRHSRLNATLVPLALVLFIGDSFLPHHFENHETDRIVIHASPQRVWQYIIDYPANHAPSDYWLTSLGLPAPVQSTADGHVVGATRRCLFTGGIAFDEKITVVEPNRELQFDVVTQPNHPEVVGHLVLQKGRFLLTDNHDGTTTVEGTSWYQLNVYPVSYYDLWTQDVIRHVHLRVMRHIKRLAESGR